MKVPLNFVESAKRFKYVFVFMELCLLLLFITLFLQFSSEISEFLE